MEIKILQVFYGKDGLPYKDKDRQVHFPIIGTGFLGASNTTKIKFYYDELDNLDETTWVAVSKLPNGKVGSRVLESHLDSELNEHYALLELDNYYTQYKGDVFISLQGYQGGVDFDYDEENSQYEIHGTPTIAATGSIKFTINYASEFVGSGETDNINFQRILAALGTKLGIRAYSEHVEELPSEGSPDIFYVVNDDPNNPNLANIYVWNENTRHYIWVGDNTLDLGDYYTKEQGDDFEEDINQEISNLKNQVNSLAQGSPRGVFNTVADLESADPSHNYIYLVLADGHWYYWDGTDWADGGTYVAAPFDNYFDEESANGVQNARITKFTKIFDGNTEYSNLFNPATIIPNNDLTSNTGELTPNANLNVSDFIEIDPTKSLSLKGNTGTEYFYCYDDAKSFLGYVVAGYSGTVISNTYPTTKYIRIVVAHTNLNSAYLMYTENLEQNYLPFSPIDGNLKKSNYFKQAIKSFDGENGYFYNDGYLDLDDTVSPKTVTIKTNSYVLGDRGYGKNTGLSLNSPISLGSGSNGNYFTIAYDKENNTFVAFYDFTGDYSNYIIFGYYQNGKVFGNLGQIYVNGQPSISQKDIIVSNAGEMGYLYNKGYMVIDTTTNPATFKLMGTSYVFGSRGYGRNTNIALNTPIELTNFNLALTNGYGTIAYQKSTNSFVCLQDYKGLYDDYIIFGYYDHGYIFGNMGMILLNGKVSNQELDKLLEDYDISGLDELQEQVDNNSTAIGVNAGSISSEASARQIADAALGARIDNLVAPSGQSVAEITDARVGYDGTIYASLEARLNAEEEKTIKRIGNILTVGVGKMYQTISAAISAAQNNDIILISKGVYEEQVNNLDKCVHIIGESKDEVIWRYPNTTYGRSPYECGMGSIRNLTIHAYDDGTPSENRAYCVHLDHFSHYQNNPPVSNYFYCENVHMINDSNEAIGIGLRPNLTVEFVNCTFECLSGDEASFYVHSSTSATTTNAKCILKNCTIVNNDSVGEKGALRVECYAVTQGGSTAIFQGNIVVNRGTGPAFLLQNRTTHYSSWDEQDDWVLDKTSQLNNIADINHD